MGLFKCTNCRGSGEVNIRTVSLDCGNGDYDRYESGDTCPECEGTGDRNHQKSVIREQVAQQKRMEDMHGKGPSSWVCTSCHGSGHITYSSEEKEYAPFARDHKCTTCWGSGREKA